MALTNVLLLSQIAGYVIGLILSLCITVPMSMHQDEFNGHCLLFSKGVWQETDGQLLVTWASRCYCDYVIAVGVVMFAICLVQIYRLSMFMYKGTDSSFLSAFVEALVCGVVCALAVPAAAFITLGFMSWCTTIVQRFPRYYPKPGIFAFNNILQLNIISFRAYYQVLQHHGYYQVLSFINNTQFPSCEDAAGQDIDKKDKISTNGFYIEIGTAQFGAWGAFATWVGLAVFSTLKVCRYHQLQNIRVSMFRERQRLVHEGDAASNASTPPPQRAHVLP